MHPNTDPNDEEYVMPCAEAMLAGTLALMTGHAQSACARQRILMAKKIRSNLYFLGQNPDLTPNFRTVVQRMHLHWDALVNATEPPPATVLGTENHLLPETRMWHAAASQVH
ncbi:hypothetical protein [Hydrogenophaga sp.]|uniref:hypothetical protein n=1 Tax=Hydrogenophaga sp. TaxID=1904254 RepID=UPI00271F5A2A|nr:hypothetical protein [Hydrogenophaga sp.]MDO9201183.1 hypothetical protein [Hydrogenophaga sp.]MDP2073448.1 hypothetical protein [Hydrogenophaga sp.]